MDSLRYHSVASSMYILSHCIDMPFAQQIKSGMRCVLSSSMAQAWTRYTMLTRFLVCES